MMNSQDGDSAESAAVGVVPRDIPEITPPEPPDGKQRGKRELWWMPGGSLNPEGEDSPLRVLPGSKLAAELDSYDVSQLDSDQLDDGILAWERLTAWCQARQYAWITELAWRVENATILRMSTHSSADKNRARTEEPRVRDAIMDKIHLTGGASVAELSALLSISSYESRQRLETAQALDTYLLETAEALETGTITASKATLMATRLKEVDPLTALAVEEAALPVGAQQPRSVMARHIDRSLIEVDPGGASQAHLRARTRRRVDFPTALPDGMACLRAVLPADQAQLIHSNLTAVALGRKSDNDDRTIDQLRADVLLLLATDPGCCLDSQHDPADGQRQKASATSTSASASASSENIEQTKSTEQCESSAPYASPLRDTSTSPVEDAVPVQRHAHTRSCYEVLVTVSADTLAAAISDTSSHPAREEHQKRFGPHKNAESIEPGSNRATTAPAPTLKGHGPISPLLATMLASSPRARWRLAVVDDKTGKILSVARRTYKPPPDLARIIRAQEPECVFPSCIRPSEACDLDHTIPFNHTDPDSGGLTDPGNLAPLCRTHHNLKTLGLWHLVQPEEGLYEWTSLLGHKYTYRPRTPDSIKAVHEVFTPEEVLHPKEESSTPPPY